MKDRDAANRKQLHVYLYCSSMFFAYMPAGMPGIATCLFALERDEVSMLAECDSVLRADKAPGASAGCELCCGRRGDACRCCADDADGHGWCLCGQRHLQGWQPLQARQGHCAGVLKLLASTWTFTICLSRSLHYAEYCLYSQGGCSGFNRAVSTCLCM